MLASISSTCWERSRCDRKCSTSSGSSSICRERHNRIRNIHINNFNSTCWERHDCDKKNTISASLGTDALITNYPSPTMPGDNSTSNAFSAVTTYPS